MRNENFEVVEVNFMLIEIDKLNGVYKVKGVDMLAKVRSLI